MDHLLWFKVEISEARFDSDVCHHISVRVPETLK